MRLRGSLMMFESCRPRLREDEACPAGAGSAAIKTRADRGAAPAGCAPIQHAAGVNFRIAHGSYAWRGGDE